MTCAASERLHVVQLGLFNDPARRGPGELLDAWPTLVDVAEAAATQVRVSVVQACVRGKLLERAGVRYHFLPVRIGSAKGAPTALGQLLRELAPQVLHVHGLDCARDVPALARLVPGVPILLQDHASRPPRIWRRASWRRGLASAAGVAFCAAEQAQPFAAAGLLTAGTRVYEVPESTCRFAPGDREAARHATGLYGEPAVLWVGHLDANKDPLTVLNGISAATSGLPGLQLWCCFGTAPLLRPVQQRIARDVNLRERAHLLGQVAHVGIEQLMRAADVFVLGSHREGSGYSLIEALACGLSPVVTDIPSFRVLTGGGAVGCLWPCGDAQALRAALQSVATGLSNDRRLMVRAHFERELSFGALGAKLAAMYHDLRDGADRSWQAAS